MGGGHMGRQSARGKGILPSSPSGIRLHKHHRKNLFLACFAVTSSGKRCLTDSLELNLGDFRHSAPEVRQCFGNRQRQPASPNKDTQQRYLESVSVSDNGFNGCHLINRVQVLR